MIAVARGRSRSGRICCVPSRTSRSTGSGKRGRDLVWTPRCRWTTTRSHSNCSTGRTPAGAPTARRSAWGSWHPRSASRLWTQPDWTYPSTVLLAAEAVHASKEQGLRPSEDLDSALRRAFWLESRSIAHRQVILEVAAEVESVDTAALADALDTGRARSEIFADHELATTTAVQGSPHLFLPDGSDVHNPGITVHWEGPWASGYPIAQSNDPTWPDRLLKQATAA